LSQVLGFAKQSNGGIQINSKPGKGTDVRIYLPRSKANARHNGVHEIAAATPETHAGGDVLLVDDDNAVREVAAAMLRDLGYRVHEAGSGGAALDFIDSSAPVDMIVVDFAMPGMNGAEVARRVRVMRPRLPILFVTGFADRSALTGIPDAHVIGKPFTREDLGDKILIVLGHSAGSNSSASAPLHAPH
jgi:CheY-like chemotaxis protein